MLPKTGKEARTLGLPRYFTGVKCKRGHLSERYSNSGHCVECDNERQRPEGQLKEASKRYYDSHKNQCMQANKEWLKKSGLGYSYTKKSRANNPGKTQYWNAKRHASKLERTPGWMNAGHLFEIECIYRYCAALRGIGLDYEVDHIVPLQGESVSGLHLPWNMQIIMASENAKKGNRFDLV